MNFTIRTDCVGEHALQSESELAQAVGRLSLESGAFLCVEPERPVQDITYMQAAYIRKTKGLFKKTVIASYYEVEVQEEMPNGDLYQYFFTTEHEPEALRVFCDFFLTQKRPDLTGWRRELFYQARN